GKAPAWAVRVRRERPAPSINPVRERHPVLASRAGTSAPEINRLPNSERVTIAQRRARAHVMIRNRTGRKSRAAVRPTHVRANPRETALNLNSKFMIGDGNDR